MDFYYDQFAAAAPGYPCESEWRKAIAGEKPSDPDALAPCPVPVMIRRRMAPLGRLALSVLSELAPRDQEPLVFASSWGESSRTKTMLADALSPAQAVSPAGFSASVHNAVAGAAGIWLKNHTAAPAISAGSFTSELALLHCAALLKEGPSSVVFVRYDEPLPQEWAPMGRRLEDCAIPYAWAMRLVREKSGRSRSFSLEALRGAEPAPGRPVPPALPEDIVFFYSGVNQRNHTDQNGNGWRWAQKEGIR